MAWWFAAWGWRIEDNGGYWDNGADCVNQCHQNLVRVKGGEQKGGCFVRNCSQHWQMIWLVNGGDSKGRPDLNPPNIIDDTDEVVINKHVEYKNKRRKRLTKPWVDFWKIPTPIMVRFQHHVRGMGCGYIKISKISLMILLQLQQKVFVKTGTNFSHKILIFYDGKLK